MSVSSIGPSAPIPDLFSSANQRFVKSLFERVDRARSQGQAVLEQTARAAVRELMAHFKRPLTSTDDEIWNNDEAWCGANCSQEILDGNWLQGILSGVVTNVALSDYDEQARFLLTVFMLNPWDPVRENRILANNVRRNFMGGERILEVILGLRTYPEPEPIEVSPAPNLETLHQPRPSQALINALDRAVGLPLNELKYK